MNDAVREGAVDRLAYTVDELAEAAGVCRDNLYAAVRADQLKAKKFGKRTLVLKSDAEAFLRALPDLKLAPKEPRTKRSKRTLRGGAAQ